MNRLIPIIILLLASMSSAQSLAPDPNKRSFQQFFCPTNGGCANKGVVIGPAVDAVSCGRVQVVIQLDRTSAADATFAGTIQQGTDARPNSGTWSSALTIGAGTFLLPAGRQLFRVNVSAAPASGSEAEVTFRCQDTFSSSGSAIPGLDGEWGDESTLEYLMASKRIYPPETAPKAYFSSADANSGCLPPGAVDAPCTESEPCVDPELMQTLASAGHRVILDNCGSEDVWDTEATWLASDGLALVNSANSCADSYDAFCGSIERYDPEDAGYAILDCYTDVGNMVTAADGLSGVNHPISVDGTQRGAFYLNGIMLRDCPRPPATTTTDGLFIATIENVNTVASGGNAGMVAVDVVIEDAIGAHIHPWRHGLRGTDFGWSQFWGGSISNRDPADFDEDCVGTHCAPDLCTAENVPWGWCGVDAGAGSEAVGVGHLIEVGHPAFVVASRGEFRQKSSRFIDGGTGSYFYVSDCDGTAVRSEPLPDCDAFVYGMTYNMTAPEIESVYDTQNNGLVIHLVPPTAGARLAGTFARIRALPFPPTVDTDYDESCTSSGCAPVALRCSGLDTPWVGCTVDATSLCTNCAHPTHSDQLGSGLSSGFHMTPFAGGTGETMSVTSFGIGTDGWPAVLTSHGMETGDSNTHIDRCSVFNDAPALGSGNAIYVRQNTANAGTGTLTWNVLNSVYDRDDGGNFTNLVGVFYNSPSGTPRGPTSGTSVNELFFNTVFNVSNGVYETGTAGVNADEFIGNTGLCNVTGTNLQCDRTCDVTLTRPMPDNVPVPSIVTGGPVIRGFLLNDPRLGP